MVKVEKIEYEKGYIFRIITDEGTFSISFCGNLDLYFNFECDKCILDEPNIRTIRITKENYFLYSIFCELFQNIKNCNIYCNYKNIGEDFEDSIFLDRDLNEEVRKSEKDNPKRLFHDEIVDFHSDDYTYEETSRLIIKQLEDEIELTFIKGRTDVLSETFAVRICNSGSRHQPFNVLFMNLYNKLIEYQPEFHQISIEEILYEMRRVRKK